MEGKKEAMERAAVARLDELQASAERSLAFMCERHASLSLTTASTLASTATLALATTLALALTTTLALTLTLILASPYPNQVREAT